MNPRPLRLLAAFLGLIVLARGAFAAPAAGPEDAATATAVASAAAEAADSSRIENAVVKVFSTVRWPESYRPWTKQAPRELTGSGVVIEGRRILTNAHVVLYASQVQIQANQSGDKIPATVESVAPEIDLAVLKLEDETFFDSHGPLARAKVLPSVKDPVLVYGYPTGGTSLSITKGIVSRIEFTAYNFPVAGLRIQIDAAINHGNSGGPAVAGDRMIGLAFSRLGGKAENIGYIIPCEEIDYFLHAVAHGARYRKPAMFDVLQTLENPALRASLHLDKSVTGMVVNHPDEDDPAYPLRKWDVITKIGSTPIDDQGMILTEGRPRLALSYLIQSISRDGTVPVTVVREGKTLQLQARVPSERIMLIPPEPGKYPSYFVFGPLVFSSATTEFMEAFDRHPQAMTALAAFGSPLATRRGDRPAYPGEQLVVVSSPFFPHRLSRGYGNPQASVVKSVNGVHVKNLAHLVELLRDSREKFLTLDFDSRVAETLVFPRAEMVAATDDILSDNGIRSQGSSDMLAIWNAKASAK